MTIAWSEENVKFIEFTILSFLCCLFNLFRTVAVTGDRKQNKSSKHAESFEEKLARADPDFLQFLKNEKSDLLGFESGELSEDSDDSAAEIDKPKKAKSAKVKEIQIAFVTRSSFTMLAGCSKHFQVNSRLPFLNNFV